MTGSLLSPIDPAVVSPAADRTRPAEIEAQRTQPGDFIPHRVGSLVPLRPVHKCECGDHSWVLLTSGFITLFDNEDARWIGRSNWFSNSATKPYAARNLSNGSVMFLHRFMMGDPKGYVIDHINRNSLDNRTGNLRIATSLGNTWNRKKASNRPGKYKGVTKRGETKWQACIKPLGVHHYLGTFKSDIEAAKAYDAAARLHYGPFAFLNFPEDRT